MKKAVEIAIISDVHLGTYGCHAKELLNYLNSIDPQILILNGDIIDIWQFSKRYFPESHMQVIKKIIDMSASTTKVYYISGNHDELFRKFIPMKLGNIEFVNKLFLRVNGKKLWVFHGDIYDFTMKQTKWLAKLGGKGYDLLILMNRLINRALNFFGKEKVSFSKTIKNSVKKALQFIDDYEKTIAEMAEQNGSHYVACGHIHTPCIKEIMTKNTVVNYLNSGDWVESLTALEYIDNEWEIFHYQDNIPKVESSLKFNKLSYEDIIRDTGNWERAS